MTYQAGELDQLVTIKRKSRTANGSGGWNVAWVDLLPNLPAMVKPLRVTEQVQADKVATNVLYRFVVRSAFAGAFNEADVIVWNSTTFNIREILPFPRSPWLEIVGEAGVAA